MSKTNITGGQVKDGSIQKKDLDTTTTTQAVITKVIAGTNVSITSTGVDAGTGEVTINASGGSGDTTALESRLDTAEGNITTLQTDVSQLAAVATSGDYADLINKPVLATVATSGSYNDLSNTPVLTTVATSGNYNDLTNKPVLATVATSGSYNDLSNRPALSAVCASGSYNDLSDRPNLAAVAVSGSYIDLMDSPNLAAVATSGSYIDLTNKPTIPNITQLETDVSSLLTRIGTAEGSITSLESGAFSGSYTDLTNKPALATVATSGSYTDLSNKPVLATVATSGSYNDLTNLPAASSGGMTVNWQYFGTSGTWTKPAGAKLVRVICIGAGGGGASGRKGAAGTNRVGGGGGGSGAVVQVWFEASMLSSQEVITVGAGGAGGASVTTNDTDGNSGVNGGDTLFGAETQYSPVRSKMFAAGGGRGAGASGATSGAAGGGPINYADLITNTGNRGGAQGTTGVAASYLTRFAPAPGSSGGGLTTANAWSRGGGRHVEYNAYGGQNQTLTANPTPNVEGADGAGAAITIVTDGSSHRIFGLNGCGGNSSATGNAGAGGAGSGPGFGGAGGGAATNDMGNSGAGAAGGNGAVYVITYF